MLGFWQIARENDEVKQVIVPVISNAEIMPQVHLLSLEAPEIAAVARPGQFVMVRCGESHDPLLRRPLSIHRATGAGQIVLLFGVVGRGTRWLSRCRKAHRVDLLGPLGNGFSIEPTAQSILLVAGGIGIAPLIFLAEDAFNAGQRVTLLMGARSASALCPRALLPSHGKVAITTEDGSEGRRGMATDAIDDLVEEIDQVFACGPISMYRSMAAKECLAGKPVQITLEMMMGCGLGACYGCVVRTRSGPRQVCHDGPVFELGEIIW